MATKPARVRVWDRFVRTFHWSLVASFATAYFYTEHIGWVHKGAGYLALALIAARCVWGFTAPSPHARFASFVPTPSRLWNYLRQLLQGREPRHLGHNPAGAVMILYLLVAVVVIAVLVHVGANLYESLRHRENMFKAMVTGEKNAPQRQEPRR